MTKYLQKEDLVTLARQELGTRDPGRTTIDKLISEKTLHECDSNDVLSAAYELGLLISYCTKDGIRYKANGLWVIPNEELAQKLKTYTSVSGGYCNKCKTEVIQQIEKRKPSTN